MDTEEAEKQRRVNMEIITTGTKKRSPDGLAMSRAHRLPGVATPRSSGLGSHD